MLWLAAVLLGGLVLSRRYPRVSVVIPTHNRRRKLARLIESILRSDYPRDRLEIIVVDDASTDGTAEFVRSRFGELVRVVRNEHDLFLAESRNVGVRASSGEYVLVIDDDNVVDRGMIRELVEFMERHRRVGVAGPLMYFLGDPRRIWCAGVVRNYWLTLTRLLGFNEIDRGQYVRPFVSEEFPNAFMVRREVFERVGLFNSRLFTIHYDEADFCQRVRAAGYLVVTVPSAKVWHDIPLPERSRASVLHLKSPLRVYFAVRNRFLFHWLWSRGTAQRVVSFFASLGFTLLYVLVILVDRSASDKKRLLVAVKRALLDALRIISRSGR